ncbi:MAG: molybdenum cofactor guanylyltransferase [Acidimicrobiia bacterium]|nr:molybdenum cofactor guanylyltransferase [Acidimicrobiia bacterium]
MGSFAGAVLTGGSSRRMGRDKALLPVRGQPLALTVADALRRAGAEPVLCVGGDEAALVALGLRTIPDLHPGEGPVGGLITALSAVESEVVVVLAVDLPGADPDAVCGVVSALHRTSSPDQAADPADLAVPLVDGRRQWLHAAWRSDTALPVLRAAFDQGERAVHRAVAGLRVVDVVGVDPAVVADVDRPADLPPMATAPATGPERH